MVEISPSERACVLCQQVCSREQFSAFQWGEGRLARCRRCAQGLPPPELRQTLPPPRNNKNKSSVGLQEDKVTQDGLWTIASGEYGDGRPCTAMYYRDLPLTVEGDLSAQALGERSLYRLAQRLSQRAQRIVRGWNAAHRAAEQQIHLQVGDVMQVASPTSPHYSRQLLVKPALDPVNARKLNSNSGWVLATTDEEPCSQLAQALSHFSYHSTGGEMLLCDLVGAQRDDGTGLVLSECSAHSRGQSHGPTDLGRDGMVNFFAHHVCGPLCGRHWLRPPNAARIFAATRQTAVACPQTLPPQVAPQVAPPQQHAVIGAHRVGVGVGEFFVDSAAVRDEREQLAAEARAASEAQARLVAKAAVAAEEERARRLSTEAKKAAARAAFVESMTGINGITGVIGRQPTSQPRRTVHELLVRNPQGWRELEPLEAQMGAPNDGTFFAEPERGVGGESETDGNTT
jgi:hypothetical protein